MDCTVNKAQIFSILLQICSILYISEGLKFEDYLVSFKSSKSMLLSSAAMQKFGNLIYEQFHGIDPVIFQHY